MRPTYQQTARFWALQTKRIDWQAQERCFGTVILLLCGFRCPGFVDLHDGAVLPVAAMCQLK